MEPEFAEAMKRYLKDKKLQDDKMFKMIYDDQITYSDYTNKARQSSRERCGRKKKYSPGA